MAISTSLFSFFDKLWPWSKSQSVVGIDIGSSSIKVVQLRKEKEQAILETYGELAAGPYGKMGVGQAVRLPEETMVEMLKDLFKESGVNAKRAVAAIPLKSSFVTSIRVPLVSGGQMAEVIKFEARKYIPISLEEVEMSWWILPQTKESSEKKAGGVQMVDVILTAVHKETVQKYRDMISKSGLSSASYEIETFSVLRSSIFRQTVPVMIIDFGASSTRMCIIDNGILKITHNIGRGSQDLTLALSKSLGISFERAEEMKREIGLSTRPEHKEIVGVMEPILNFIFSEAHQLMLGYTRKYNESVGKAILTGSGFLMNNSIDMAVKSLGIEVSLADSFAKTVYPVFLQEALRGAGPTFSVALGSALRNL